MSDEPAATDAADADDRAPCVTIFRVPTARLPVLIAILGVVVGAGGISCVLMGADGMSSRGSSAGTTVALLAGIILIAIAAVLSIAGVAIASHQPDRHIALIGSGILHYVTVTPAHRRLILAASTEEPVLPPPPIILSYAWDGGVNETDLRPDNAVLSHDDRMWAYIWDVMVCGDDADPLVAVTFVTHPNISGRQGRFIKVTSDDDDTSCLIDPKTAGYSTLMTMIDDGC